MTITKCDICKQEIKKEDVKLSLTLFGPALFINRALCMTCGKPIIAFLKKHRLDQDRPRRAA
jgi:hypothetical protein